MAQQKATLEEVIKTFREYNRVRGITYGSDPMGHVVSAVIVFSKENWAREYTEQERSYRITNMCGKAFFSTPSGSISMTGNCLDGKDSHVRLDAYRWKVDYCYFEQDMTA